MNFHHQMKPEAVRAAAEQSRKLGQTWTPLKVRQAEYFGWCKGYQNSMAWALTAQFINGSAVALSRMGTVRRYLESLTVNGPEIALTAVLTLTTVLLVWRYVVCDVRYRKEHGIVIPRGKVE